MSLSETIACSLYDPATGTVVQLNSIHQDSEFSISGADEEDAVGNGVYLGDEATLDLYFYDKEPAKITQLRTWQENETPLRLAAVGTRSNILWNESVAITFQEPRSFTPQSRSVSMIHMSAKGVKLPIWQGKNLLHGAILLKGFSSGWADADSDGVADGYDVNNAANYSFTNGQQVFDGSSSAELFETSMILPVSNQKLTLSFRVVNPGAQQNSQNRVFVNDFSGSQLLFEQLFTTVEAGIRSLTFKTPADAYEFDLELLSLDPDDSGLTIDRVMLAAGDNTTYVAG